MGTPMAVAVNSTVNNTTYPSSRSVDADVVPRISKTLPRAKTATLTTRTNNTDASLTFEAGHGIITGDRLDLYWDVGGVKGHRRQCLVGTVAGNVVPITVGSGDNLPVQGSALIGMVPSYEDLVITGNNVQFYAFKAPNTVRALVVFTDSTPVEKAAEIISAGQSAVWDVSNGVTNPLAGDAVTRIYFSHADAVNPQTVSGDVGYN